MLNKLAKEVSKFVVGTEGNVSQRIGESFLIKKSGTRLKDQLFVDGSDSTASIEASFHKTIYTNSDFNFICHTHPINLLKILCSGKSKQFASIRIFPDQVVFNPEYCIINYAHPGEDLSNELFNNITSDSFPSIFLLEHHGLITCGYTIDQCLIATEICEKAAEIFLSGGIIGLSHEHIDKIKLDKKELSRGKCDNLR